MSKKLENKNDKMDIDSALAKVGGFKRWHVGMFFLAAFSLHVPLCWQGLSIVFEGWEPPHQCKDTETGSPFNPYATTLNQNGSFPIQSTSLYPSTIFTDGSNLSSKNGDCYQTKAIYVNTSTHSNKTVAGYAEAPCTSGWVYQNEGFYTIVEQWDLVCDKNYQADMSQSFFQGASLVGELVLSPLVDRYGRKMTHIVSHLLVSILGTVTAFSVSYPMYVVFKSLVGFFITINITSGAMLILEFFDSRHRTIPGMMLQNIWTTCYLILPGLAYLIKNWSHFQLTISLASIGFAALFYLLPESPAWLYSKKRVEEAEEILHKIARWNKIELNPETKLLESNETLEVAERKENGEKQAPVTTPSPDIVIAKSSSEVPICIEDRETSEPPIAAKNKLSLKIYIKDRILLRFVVVSSLLWFSSCLVFYGLILATPGIGGNRFVNFAVLGFVEYPANLLAAYFSRRIGRRLTSSVTQFVAGCFVAVIIFIPTETSNGTSLFGLKLALVILAKGFISATFATMILYTKEFFPTVLRASSCGICQMWGRVGALIAPMTAYMTKTSVYWVPNVIFGVVSIATSLLVLFLPETNNQPMPETVEDCHKLDREQPFWRCMKKQNKT